MIPTLYTPKQAADKLNVKPSAVYELIRTGKLLGLRITQHNIRIEEAEIERYLTELRNQQSVRDQAINIVHHRQRKTA